MVGLDNLLLREIIGNGVSVGLSGSIDPFPVQFGTVHSRRNRALCSTATSFRGINVDFADTVSASAHGSL